MFPLQSVKSAVWGRCAVLGPLSPQVMLQKYEFTNKKVFKVHSTLLSLNMPNKPLKHVSLTNAVF